MNSELSAKLLLKDVLRSADNNLVFGDIERGKVVLRLRKDIGIVDIVCSEKLMTCEVIVDDISYGEVPVDRETLKRVLEKAIAVRHASLLESIVDDVARFYGD